MNDITKQAKDRMIEEAREWMNAKGIYHSISILPEHVAAFALEREAQLRAEIAEELDTLLSTDTRMISNRAGRFRYNGINDYIEKLRTNPESPQPRHADEGQTPSASDTCECGHEMDAHSTKLDVCYRDPCDCKQYRGKS